MKSNNVFDRLLICFAKTQKIIELFPTEKWLVSPLNDLRTSKEVLGQLLVTRWVNFQYIKDLKVDREKFGVHIRRIAPKSPNELIDEEKKMETEMITYFSELNEIEWHAEIIGFSENHKDRSSFLHSLIEQEYQFRGQLLTYFELFGESAPII